MLCSLIETRCIPLNPEFGADEVVLHIISPLALYTALVIISILRLYEIHLFSLKRQAEHVRVW